MNVRVESHLKTEVFPFVNILARPLPIHILLFLFFHELTVHHQFEQVTDSLLKSFVD